MKIKFKVPYKLTIDLNGYKKEGVGYAYSTNDDDNEKDEECIVFGVALTDGSITSVKFKNVLEFKEI